MKKLLLIMLVPAIALSEGPLFSPLSKFNQTQVQNQAKQSGLTLEDLQIEGQKNGIIKGYEELFKLNIIRAYTPTPSRLEDAIVNGFYSGIGSVVAGLTQQAIIASTSWGLKKLGDVYAWWTFDKDVAVVTAHFNQINALVGKLQQMYESQTNETPQQAQQRQALMQQMVPMYYQLVCKAGASLQALIKCGKKAKAQNFVAPFMEHVALVSQLSTTPTTALQQLASNIQQAINTK